MEAVMMWPSVAVLGFMALAGLVIGLGRGSTARYEYERNRVANQPQGATVVAPVTSAVGGGAAIGPVGDGSLEPGHRDGAAVQRSSVDVAAHPAGRSTVQGASAEAWWLLDERADQPLSRVVAGPFADRIDAEWAALATGLDAPTRAVYGRQHVDGALERRQSPQFRAWIAELDGHLDRLSADWDVLLSDDDSLTTLVVEVGAALVEAGVLLHDCAGRGPDGAGPTGGVCLTPDLGSDGILVSWHPHDRVGLHQVRGPAAAAMVGRTMTAAVADVLTGLGFSVELLDSGTCCLVTSPTHG